MWTCASWRSFNKHIGKLLNKAKVGKAGLRIYVNNFSKGTIEKYKNSLEGGLEVLWTKCTRKRINSKLNKIMLCYLTLPHSR